MIRLEYRIEGRADDTMPDRTLALELDGEADQHTVSEAVLAWSAALARLVDAERLDPDVVERFAQRLDLRIGEPAPDDPADGSRWYPAAVPSDYVVDE